MTPSEVAEKSNLSVGIDVGIEVHILVVWVG
jgi:hypothetical protein